MALPLTGYTLDKIPTQFWICLLALPTSHVFYPTRLDKADWPNFSFYVEKRLKKLDSNLLNPLGLYNHFQSVLIEAADKFIPKKKIGSSKIPSPPWWDAECTAAIKERKNAERKYNDSGLSEDFIEFQKISARAKRLLKKAKKKGWKGFCESLNPRKNAPLAEFADKLAPPSVPEESCIDPYPPSTGLGPLELDASRAKDFVSLNMPEDHGSFGSMTPLSKA
ncbi:hypothetical protein MSG28_008625 [Choristoneura fumiferana]|uniref:Uncharacterized protein n=1 Tax=Choristoneura fumiferana TaxID=7141 RepID=A0ACC0J7H6_CHOFU|nr:hypothetical protein MSG28_008625 [Choristoneura fumiferana]